MSYALSILWYERQRFFAAVLAVAFSAVLICVQFGLLFGAFALTSIPIDYSKADIWLGGPDIASVDVAKPIPRSYFARLQKQPEITNTELYALGFGYWIKPDGGAELCIVVGANLSEKSLGAVPQLTEKMRSQLSEPGAIIVDQSELGRLGIKGIGDVVQMGDRRVRVVNLVRGLSGLQGPYVFCSVQTAKQILRMSQEQTIYVLGKCKNPEDVGKVVERLQKYPQMSVLSSQDFSWRSRMHWLTKTKGGIALGFAAVLGLLVGAVVTRQSLYSATIASIREYAVLRAMGIPRWRMGLNLGFLAFWVGLTGISLAIPGIFGLAEVFALLNVPLMLPWWLIVTSGLVTWSMAILSGLSTLSSLKHAEPTALLR